VKRHCERTGTPCVYLDRPSLSRFERALGCAQGAPSRGFTSAPCQPRHALRKTPCRTSCPPGPRTTSDPAA
jgi:hypothetical protein